MFKWLLLVAAALLMPSGVVVADETNPPHYHAGEVQIVVGPLCNRRSDALEIIEAMSVGEAHAIEVFKALFPACQFLSANPALIIALEERRAVTAGDGQIYTAMLATVQSPTGRTYYMTLTEKLPGKGA